MAMNERIKELAEQSGFFPVPNETETDWEYRAENARYEKFVELVVEESIKVMKLHDYHGEWLGEKIKSHFGIPFESNYNESP